MNKKFQCPRCSIYLSSKQMLEFHLNKRKKQCQRQSENRAETPTEMKEIILENMSDQCQLISISNPLQEEIGGNKLIKNESKKTIVEDDDIEISISLNPSNPSNPSNLSHSLNLLNG